MRRKNQAPEVKVPSSEDKPSLADKPGAHFRLHFLTPLWVVWESPIALGSGEGAGFID